MKNLQSEIESELLDHLVPFWEKLIDRLGGGLFGNMTDSLQIVKEGPKGGIYTARHLWAFSRLKRHYGGDRFDKVIDETYAFLMKHLIDQEDKGCLWAVDRMGQVLDDRKHIYVQAFVMYALSEYYMVSNDAEALDLAISLYELIETIGYDKKNHGYLEEFTKDWQPAPNEMLSENGVTAYFTMNTHLHILEAYTNLYRVWPNKGLRSRLKNLVEVFATTIFDPKRSKMKVFFDTSWDEIIDLYSYGHDIEASWLLWEAVTVLEEMEEVVRPIVLAIGKAILKEGLMEDGSLRNEREGSYEDEKRVWWVQAEAMVGFMNLFTITGEDVYKDATLNSWAYIRDHIRDRRPGGEWHAAIGLDGKPLSLMVVEPWKSSYHNVRALVEMIERVDVLNRLYIGEGYSL